MIWEVLGKTKDLEKKRRLCVQACCWQGTQTERSEIADVFDFVCDVCIANRRMAGGVFWCECDTARWDIRFGEREVDRFRSLSLAKD